jgi:hypothetical protein
MQEQQDGYLFDELIPGGPDNKRSWNVSNAFGHYTRKVVPSEERRTFHGLRNTFTEAMEAAVPEKPDHRHRRLLCARRERPRHRRAKCDEIAPPHLPLPSDQPRR